MSYSIQERAYFDQLFAAVDNQDSGVLAGQDALPLLMAANLPQQTLGEIWAIADPDNNGFLTRESWYKAARLVGWLQKGGKTTVDEALASQAGPLPTFHGQAPPPVTPQATGPRLPPLSPADRAKFTKIFVGCGPSNGLVSGDKARDVFVKSQLDYDKLGQIWNLADTQGRGSLDLTDFIIGMYLIQSCMANPALALPAVLPPGTYEAASGGRGPASPIVRQNTGPASPQYRQPTPVRGANWDVTTEAKNTSDRFFEQLDTQNRGYIEGDVAVPFMLQSQLDEGTLAAIWDLADIRKEGKLNKDEFAVAMHLINAKLAGRDPPATLPTSLVPPSLRNEPTQPPQTSAAKDLFDLFADEPIGPSFPSQAPPPPVQTVRSPIQSPQVRSPQIKSPQLQSPQVRSPQADLMGEEDQPIADNSAEIGNKRNQLENTNRGLDSMQKERPGLEKAATSGADELKELEGKLIAARSKHESESKAVAELKARVSEQKDKIQSVNMDYIAAQSDVSALQSERDELEQALLAGKEEVRDLNKRMKEIAEEKAGLLLLLEKLKKETRQQKGMVSIAKKQLATAEGGRDSVQGEIRALEATPEATEAAAVPLPSTPRALSPATSQRSNNPFDRFREGAKSPAGVLGAGALIGAAAGVVVAGAETLYEAAKDVVSPDEAKSEADQVHEFAEHVREPKQATDFDSAFAEYGQEGLPSGIPKSAIPYMRADERSASTQAVRGDSMPESPASTVPGVGESSLRNVADDSSDEDEGPEDVEAIKYRSDNTPILYPPVAQVEAPKSRRSAPPPPPRIVEELDPFGENSEAGEDPASATFDPSGAETVPATVHAQSDLFGASDVARNVPVPTGTAPRENDVFDTVQGVAVKSDSSRAAESAESRATPAGAPLAGETDALGSMQDDGAQSDPFDASLDHVKPETDPVGPAGGQTDPFGALQGTTQSDPFGLPLQGAPAPTKLGFDDDEFASMGQPKSTVEAPAAVGDAGKPEQVLPPGAAPAVKSGFDDDDFDFSDAPPVQMNVPPAPMNAKAPAKDDFDFDDEFEQPSNSDGSKSYEMVSPPSGGLAPPIPQTDAWGMQAPPTQPSSAFSFDDAFGENSLNPPTLPERRESGVGAQPDDIEDVKKLCAMGFPRSLVIEALGANGYDFQKTLNVLLQ